MQQLPLALAPLGAFKQFICYVLTPSSRQGKMDKLPVSVIDGSVCDSQNPANWVDVDAAIAAAARFGDRYGVAFVFTPNDPFFFLDIDSCVVDGAWSPLSTSLMSAFNGAAVEVSSSGKGLHIFGAGTCPPHRCKNTKLGLELYTSGRFAALTGLNAIGTAAIDCSAVLPWLVASYFSADENVTDGGWTDGPCEGWHGPEDDDALIDRALRSQSASATFGNRASFRELFDADHAALMRAYPDDTRSYDASSADAALAQHLAFWTGKDCERIQRIMNRSQLVRDKWEREDYIHMTITNACNRQVDVLQDKLPQTRTEATAVIGTAPTMQKVTGSTFLSIEDQLKFFEGCVYIVDAHKILTPGGYMLKPDQFKVTYGGYSFPMDFANERVTRNAWEAFTESQGFRAPKADSTTFRPDKLPGELIVDAGRVRANSWWPIDVPRMKGDPSPFIKHLHKILPIDADREIVLAYMAACVQYQGQKFQWAPLIQGAEGNGKTLLSRCVAAAIGIKYCFFPRADQIAEKFNGWLFDKIFIGVEDIRIKDADIDILEVLKPMITGDNLAKREMQQGAVNAEVCANFILNSNYKDAIKAIDPRRFAMFFCAQQTKDDCERDGMDSLYFSELYDWLKRENGYAIVTELLFTYSIPDRLNPTKLCQRAPKTSSSLEHRKLSLGSIEQEIMEAIEQGEPGFKGGWVSSMAVDKLLERTNRSRSIPHHKRRDLLRTLGYDWHPGLPDGRVNNRIGAPDMGKPRLYVHKDSGLQFVSGAAEIARKYTESQC